MDQIFKRQIRSLDVAGQRVEIEIRQLDSPDIEKIRQIAEKSFPKVWKDSEYEYFIKHLSGLCLGVVSQKQMVGFLLTLLVQGEMDVISIAVSPEYRRKNIAKTLLETAWERPQVRQAFLEVDTENSPAIQFYESFGFKAYGVRKKYYEGKRDALVMKRTK